MSFRLRHTETELAPTPVDRMAAFPGRWVAGVAMTTGPLLMLAGALLRTDVDFFYPAQLAAYRENSTVMATSYALFAAGNLLLWPAVAVLAAQIGLRSPGWGVWGGVLTLSGLFARAFHSGMDQMAFRLSDATGAETARDIVTQTYGGFQIYAALSPAIMVGWAILAFGAWRTRVLGPVASPALALMAALPLGVLKGTTPLSLVALAGLTFALLPHGWRQLRQRPRPGIAKVLRWTSLTLLVIAMMVLIGQAG